MLNKLEEPKAGYCVEAVREAGAWPSYHRCPRRGTVERDGKPYCRQHDPVARRAREDEKAAAEREEWEQKGRVNIRIAAAMSVCDGVTNEELQAMPRGYLRSVIDAYKRMEAEHRR